jgi:hypothetical protein
VARDFPTDLKIAPFGAIFSLGYSKDSVDLQSGSRQTVEIHGFDCLRYDINQIHNTNAGFKIGGGWLI